MTRNQMMKKLNLIIVKNHEMADRHTDLEQNKYAVSHPQMKRLYRDVAYLAEMIRILDNRENKDANSNIV
jgi:hypothetical protein